MYYFIVNPSAGGGRCGKIWKRLERQLERQGICNETDRRVQRSEDHHYRRR